MKIKKILLLAAALPLLVSCTKKPLYYNSTAPDIIAFGDSLTYGQGVTQEYSYPSVLAKLTGANVVNLGVSGNTAGQSLQRLYLIGRNKPKMVLIEFGGNDFMQQRPKEETQAALEEIIDYVHGLHAMAVIVDTGGNFEMSPYTKIMKKLAKDKQALFVPGIMDGIFNDRSLKSDIVHPNEKGYEIVAQKVFKSIYPYLNKPAK